MRWFSLECLSDSLIIRELQIRDSDDVRLRVRIEVSLPAFAQRVTVFGSTRNKDATSDGVNRTSASVSRVI
jgi:hypothetical protein